MTLERLDDVRRLIDNEIPEGPSLDYKSHVHLVARKERAELLKDITGMGNGGGGTLVYGVVEDPKRDGIPQSITPLTDRSLPGIVEDLGRNGVRPPLLMQLTSIEVDHGFLMVLEVQRSLLGPYMIQAYGEHRYYKRVGSRTVPFDEQEVRDAYALTMRNAQLQEQLWDRHVLPIPVPPGAPWLSIAAVPRASAGEIFDPKDFPSPRQELGIGDIGSLFPYASWTQVEALDNELTVWSGGLHGMITHRDGSPQAILKLHRDGSVGVTEALANPTTIREILYCLNVYLFRIGSLWQRIEYRQPVQLRLGITNPHDLQLLRDSDRPSAPETLVRVIAGPEAEISLSIEVVPNDLVRPSTRHHVLRRFADRTEQAFGAHGSDGLLFEWGWLYRPGQQVLGLSVYGGALWDENGGEVAVIDEIGCIWNNAGSLVAHVEDGLVTDSAGAVLCATELCGNPGLPSDFFLLGVMRDPHPEASGESSRRPERHGSIAAPGPTGDWSMDQIWTILGVGRPWPGG